MQAASSTGYSGADDANSADSEDSDEPSSSPSTLGTELERKAKEFFYNGSRKEKMGQLYEAIQFYRKAIQLVPDIEMKISMGTQKSREHDIKANSEKDNFRDMAQKQMTDVLTKYKILSNKNLSICAMDYDQKSSHISILPAELIILIFKWVISSDLDMKSLEKLGQVCRGFYSLSRDTELWRLACLKVWGGQCGPPKKFGSWRNMFIERPRIRFTGCYISKTTYFRPGENSFQDELYRPWHIIEYFRYLRFFPDCLLMLTTPDGPQSCVSQLNKRHPRNPNVLRGRYWISSENVVVAEVRRFASRHSSGHRRRHNNCDGDQIFQLELEIRPFKDKRNYQLTWKRYSIHTTYRNGTKTITEFELVLNRFPAFWFSGVKSYNREAECALE